MSEVSKRELEAIEAELLGTPDLLITPVYQGGCRVCILSKEDPVLYNWICDKALLGTPYTRIEKLLETHIENKNISMTPIGKKSIWNHFEKHSDVKTQAKLIASRNNYVPHAGAELVSTDALSEAEIDNFDEYTELCGLYIKFREVHDKIYQKAGSLQTGDEWSQNKIQAYNTMINTQKSILAEIAKMRQSNKLIGVATKFIVENYASNIISKLGSEFNTLLQLMKRQDVSPDIIEEFEAVTSQRLASILMEEAMGAMDTTKKEFKLPN